MKPTRPIELSIILPCFNEEDCVADLVEELDRVLDDVALESEILFVNDASTDRTLEILEDLRRDHPRVRVVTHRVNSGESAGQGTGFAHARGHIGITMDADGQNDPADIPRLLDALTEGVHLVSGVRRRREDDWVKRLSSKVGNGFRNVVTGDQIGDAGCTYRAVRLDAVREVPVFNGMHRFLPTLMRSQGYAAVDLEINHRPRSGGVSKYGIGNRMWRGILDCIAVRWWRRRAVRGDRAPRPEELAESATSREPVTRDEVVVPARPPRADREGVRR